LRFMLFFSEECLIASIDQRNDTLFCHKEWV
jgi:hypothetical protein